MLRSTILASTALLAFGSGSAGAQTIPRYNLVDPSPERLASPWSDSVWVGDTLYISGHIGVDAKSGTVPALPQEEARLLLDGIKSTLAAAGLSMSDLVQTQVFSTDMTLFEDFNKVYCTYFDGQYPARSFIGTHQLLLGAHFEVTGIAVRRRQRP